MPYLFGLAVLGPVLAAVVSRFGWNAEYTISFGHLWFLLNIYLYVLWLTALESMSWMLVFLGMGARYLNHPSRALSYLSKAAFPVYIVHMPIQFGICYLLFPLPLSAGLKLIVLLAGTFGVSLLSYEFVLRRSMWIRPLFGMKLGKA